MRNEMLKIGADVKPSESQIFPIKVKDNSKTRDIGAALIEQHMYASAITFPAVREKDSRIRASILATHTKNDIFAFSEALKVIL